MTLANALKRWLLPVLATVLTACNPVMKGVGDGLMLATGIGQKAIEQQATNPTLGYLKVSSGPEALFVLGFREQGREAWFGAGPMSLTIENGVVVASAGIGDDLALHQRSGVGAEYFSAGLHTLPINEAVQLQRTRSVRGGVQMHTQAYELVAVREESVKVWAGERLNLLRVEERPVAQKSQAIRWPGAVYWVSPATGDVMASEQWLTPTRRFALVPREAQKQLVPPNYEQALQPISLSQPTRLSDVLRSDARWARQPVVAVISQAKQRQATRLQQGLLIDLREAEVSASSAQQRATLQRLHGLVQALPVSGRWAVPTLDAYWLDAKPGHNPVLAVGDRVVPVVNAGVTVITDLGEVCRSLFVPQQTVDAYLSACAVKKASHAVLVDATGQTTSLALAPWNRVEPPAVGPGSVIALAVAGLPLGSAKELAQLWWMESLP